MEKAVTNQSSELTKGLLDICSRKFFDKAYDDCDGFEQNYCCKYVLDYINTSDALKPEIKL